MAEILDFIPEILLFLAVIPAEFVQISFRNGALAEGYNEEPNSPSSVKEDIRIHVTRCYILANNPAILTAFLYSIFGLFTCEQEVYEIHLVTKL